LAQTRDREELEAETDRHLQKIAADMNVTWLRIFDVFIEFLWNRIYDGIQVDPEGLALVRRAARRGPVVVVPSHKSHVDYLVLSQVFFKNDLIPPHIAAGENLDFWPIGSVFRRGGAFFLRRSFRGDKLYATVFAAYVRRLLKEGHAVEFFIEGGRSRTGRVLLPKMGMLTMCARPVLEGSIPDVSFIPVSIGYEKVIEAGAYAKELAGGQKKKEDMTALVSSAKVLRSRYGRVYVDFDEPLSLKEMAAERGVDIPVEDDVRVGKPLINYLGHRIVYGINRVTRVTPTSLAAMVLLASERKGMGEDELSAKTARALDFLGGVGARRSAALQTDDYLDAVKEALGRLARDRLVITKTAPGGTLVYQLDESGRIALDYYKNNILHFFVPAAIVAAAVLTAGRGAVASEASVKRWALRISQILKNEISFRVDSTFEDNYEEAKSFLQSRGTITREAEGWRATEAGEEEARELAGLLASFFDTYRLMGETLELLENGAVKERKVLEAALAEARRQALDGRLARAESASQPVIRQALSLYLGEQAIRRGESGDLLLGEPGRREQLLQEIRTLLDAQPA
ncbi:MAG: 1-acyl-sn-glycerol-3-phosphate acyltransferase, partial [Myxococcota bacterium]